MQPRKKAAWKDAISRELKLKCSLFWRHPSPLPASSIWAYADISFWLSSPRTVTRLSPQGCTHFVPTGGLICAAELKSELLSDTSDQKTEDKPTLHATKTQQKPSCELRPSSRSLWWAGGLFMFRCWKTINITTLDLPKPLPCKRIHFCDTQTWIHLQVNLPAGRGCWATGQHHKESAGSCAA